MRGDAPGQLWCLAALGGSTLTLRESIFRHAPVAGEKMLKIFRACGQRKSATLGWQNGGQTRAEREFAIQYERGKTAGTKEERLLRQEQRERAKAIEAAAREAGRGPLDFPYLLLVLTLVGVGLIMLFSASFPSAYYEEGNPAYYLIRQGIFAILGITAMFIVGKINYERYRAVAKMLLIFSIILLVLVLIPGIGTGRLTHGAQRWIRLGPIQFQPSEITKVGIILYFADSISKKKDKMATLRYGIVPYVAILGVIAGADGEGTALFRYGAAARHRRGDDVRRRYPQLLGRSRLCAGAAGDLRLCDRHHHLQLEPNRHLARPVQRRVDAR